jgi:phosphatidylethanolamine-binding protein
MSTRQCANLLTCRPGSLVGAGSGRTTLLHAMLSGFKASMPPALNTTSTGPASYIGPSPPKETPPHPHKYIQLLFEQPASKFRRINSGPYSEL